MRTLPVLLAIACAAGALAVASANAFVGDSGIDYSRLPPDPAREETRLRAFDFGLMRAVEAAERAASGVAQRAELGEDAAGPVWSVEVFGAGKQVRVNIDPETGAVRATIPAPSFRMPGAAVSGEPERSPSGLMHYDLVEGTGPSPSGPSSVVRVHYSGWTVDGKQFDSSVVRGEPLDFALNQVISGWTEGVGSMKVGGKRKLLIPYQMAYGAQGRPPAIPPKALLIFDVELLAIVR
jgi:FKBP-type peptidyl-prolyl cis-trans isomerase FkpA